MKNNTIFIYTAFFLCSMVYSQKYESITTYQQIAESYYEAELYEDAINEYNHILSIKKSIFGDDHPELIDVLYRLSDIYLAVNSPDTAEEYLKEALNIQYNTILKKQTDYIKSYKKIKDLYSAKGDSSRVTTIDSLLNILSQINKDSIVYKVDSTFYFPTIIHFQKSIIDSSNFVSTYSNNDQAIELMNNAMLLYNNGLYTESIKSFDQAFKIDAEIVDKNYLLQLNFSSDSTSINEFYETLNQNNFIDTTITSSYLLLGLLDLQTSQDMKSIEKNINYYIYKNPQDIRAYQILGDLHFEYGNFLDAMAYYYKINLINFNMLETHLSMGMCLYYLNEYIDAIKKLYDAVQLDEYNAKSKYYLGLSYYELGDYNNAIKYLTESLLLDYKNDTVYYYLGLSYNMSGNKIQAIESFKQAIAINPANGYAYYELGNIYEYIFKNDLALDNYKIANKYIESDSLNFKYGLLLYKSKNYKGAMTPLRKYIIKHPLDENILNNLGEIFIQENRFPEAVDTYIRLLDINPNNEQYYLKVAESFYSLENYSSAKDYYLKALSFNGENLNVLLMLGDIYNKLYEFDTAEYFLIDALHCGEISKDLLFELGIAYGGQRKYLQALQSFKDALNFSSNDPVLHYQLGVVYKELSLFDLAIQEFELYLTYNGDDPVVNFMIAESFMLIKKYDKAIIYFEEVLRNEGYGSVNTLFQIGICNLEIENIKSAAKYFKLVLKVNPDHSLSRYNLINIYLSLNKAREAKKECDILYMLNRDLYNSSNYCTSL